MPGARRTGGRRVEWDGEDFPSAFRGMVALVDLA